MSEITMDSIWNDDLLNRKGDAEFLEVFLVHRMAERQSAKIKGSYVLNLDAGWGFGKTFFVERFKKQLELSEHPVVMIDAWKNDFSDDPYTNVIAEIEQYFQTFLDEKGKEQSAFAKAYDVVKTNAAKLAWIAFKGAAKRASRYVIAEGTEEIKEVFDQHVVKTGAHGEEIADATEAQFVEISAGIIDSFAQKRLDEFNEAKVSLDQFRDSLGKLLIAFEENIGKRLPLFILIDELDRCRPTYAIAMLERIKHLFDADNVVFVLSTDTTQLAHSINAVYGAGFDSRRYLQRFFTRTYELPKPTTDQLIASLLASYQPAVKKWGVPGTKKDAQWYLENATKHYGMSLRETEQAFDILASLTTVWVYEFPIQIAVIFPMILGHLRRQDIDDFTTEGWLLKTLALAPEWELEEVYQSDGWSEKMERFSVAEWCGSLLSTASTSLYKINQNQGERTSARKRQIQRIFEKEYHGRFGHNVVQGG